MNFRASLTISWFAHALVFALAALSLIRCDMMNDAKPPLRLEMQMEPPPETVKKLQVIKRFFDPRGPALKKDAHTQLEPPRKVEVQPKPEPTPPKAEPPPEPPKKPEPPKVEAKVETPPPPEPPKEPKPPEKPKLADLPPVPPPPVKPPPPRERPQPAGTAEPVLNADLEKLIRSQVSSRATSVGGGTGGRPDSRETLGVAGGTALTASELSRLKARITSCWNPPANVQDENLAVVIQVDLNRDGSLKVLPVVTEGSSLPGAQAFAGSAIRAITSCAPYSFLPPAKYDQWRSVEMNFNLKDLLGR